MFERRDVVSRSPILAERPIASGARTTQLGSQSLLAQSLLSIEIMQMTEIQKTNPGPYLSYGAGPDPETSYAGSKTDIAQIETSLVAGRAISAEHAQKFLSFVVSQARTNGLSTLGEGKLGADDLLGACGFGQALTAYPLIEAKLPTKLLQLHHLPNPNNTHGVLVTRIPIETPSGIETKTFLVDTTWRQYFSGPFREDFAKHGVTQITIEQYNRAQTLYDQRVEASGASIDAISSLRQSLPQPGPCMIEGLHASAVNDALLQKGFIDVSKGAAGEAYFYANNSGITFDVSAYLESAPSERLDYSPQQLQRYLGDATPSGIPYVRKRPHGETAWITANSPLQKSDELVVAERERLLFRDITAAERPVISNPSVAPSYTNYFNSRQQRTLIDVIKRSNMNEGLVEFDNTDGQVRIHSDMLSANPELESSIKHFRSGFNSAGTYNYGSRTLVLSAEGSERFRNAYNAYQTDRMSPALLSRAVEPQRSNLPPPHEAVSAPPSSEPTSPARVGPYRSASSTQQNIL